MKYRTMNEVLLALLYFEVSGAYHLEWLQAYPMYWDAIGKVRLYETFVDF